MQSPFRRFCAWSRPVRTRLTLVATILVTLALAIAAVGIVLTLRHLLLGAADSAAQTRAHQIEAAVAEGCVTELDAALLTAGDNIDVIQVVDAAGTIVVTNSPGYDRPLSPPLPPGRSQVIHGAHADSSGTKYQATALGVAGPGGDFTVLVGTSERPIHWLIVAVAVLCCLVFPLIVAGMALLTYFSVGRTLAPVDDIRRQVDDIAGGDLTRRVPVPGTGDEIATLAATMNQLLDRIEQSRREQLQFVNDASHELNSPLTTLVGLLDLARAKDQAIDPDTAASVLLPEALRLTDMVADMILLARADESGIPLRRGEVDLDEVVSGEIARLEAITDFAVHTRIVAARIDGDEEKIARALRNLIDNAVRHTRDRISVTMARGDGFVTVSVADNGPGIPEADRARVFQRFVRLDEARGRATGGSGLGLAIVSEIVQAHGGTAAITGTPGGGATVSMRLPFAPVPGPDASPGTGSGAGPRTSPDPTGGAR